MAVDASAMRSVANLLSSQSLPRPPLQLFASSSKRSLHWRHGWQEQLDTRAGEEIKMHWGGPRERSRVSRDGRLIVPVPSGRPGGMQSTGLHCSRLMSQTQTFDGCPARPSCRLCYSCSFARYQWLLLVTVLTRDRHVQGPSVILVLVSARGFGRSTMMTRSSLAASDELLKDIFLVSRLDDGRSSCLGSTTLHYYQVRFHVACIIHPCPAAMA